MKVEILETCSLVAQKGSIVEVTESQFEALGGFCRLLSDEKPVKKAEKVEETEEKPKKAVRKTTTAKK